MKRYLAITWRITRYIAIAFFGTSVFFVLLFRFINPPYTSFMLVRNVGQVFSGEKVRTIKKWVSLGEISPHLRLAAVAAEDNKFLQHHGFDIEAIRKARDHNEKTGGTRIHGASTISQQTAKNVFLWPHRSWFRKGLEVYFTVLIEFVWPKKRILEVYLNVIEMGDGLYGAEMASQTYFHKPASGITEAEAALLAGIFPDPRNMDPGHPSPYLRIRQETILRNMRNLGNLTLN
jgi:monofunctional glycosyltransferase